jgi:hypothetical protein
MITEIRCQNCGNKQEEKTRYCPECGAEDPFRKEPKFSFDKNDLPIVFEHTFNNSAGGMWRDFTRSYFGELVEKEGYVANMPDGFPRMKKSRVHVYYFLNENLEVQGPYMTERKAKEDAGIV